MVDITGESATTKRVAELADAAVASTAGVVRSYRAAPPLAGALPSSSVLSHVTVLPYKSVVVSIGVDSATAARDVADVVAAAVRAALPAEWATSKVRVQVRRIETGSS